MKYRHLWGSLSLLLWVAWMGACQPSGALCQVDGDCPASASCQEGSCICPGATKRCGQGCVAILTDAAHCGGCGQACPKGLRCVGGTCRCAAGQTLCDGECVALGEDPDHCGVCGATCKASEVCVGGNCEAKCPPSTPTACSRGCYNLQKNERHCGSCDSSCAQGEACINGKCQCPAGLEKCGDSCVSHRSDAAHCGGCDKACAQGQVCADGRCVKSCPKATPAICAGGCVNLGSNAQHCGGCGQTCPPGHTCQAGRCQCPSPLQSCGGSCVDVRGSHSHCGGCDRRCPDGKRCSLGRCVSQCHKSHPDLCLGSCVDSQRDPRHCGACNKACPGGQGCQAGKCVCPNGMRFCGKLCIHPKRDPLHCGACDNACAAGQLCADGRCVTSCPKTTPTACFGGCVDIGNSAQHCGACGRGCSASQRCVQGKCACLGTLQRCAESCVDLQSDAAHCGTCDNTCPSSQRCIKGRCLGCDPADPNCTCSQSERCNGKDDDCDGEIDEAWPLKGKGCSKGVGICLAQGSLKCNATQDGLECDATPKAPAAQELCNGKDDDCNGAIDEGLGQSSCGVGGCTRTVPNCDKGQRGVCQPGSPKASEECFNGIDDNCDGKTDEGCPCLHTQRSDILQNAHFGRITRVAFSPSGDRIASSGIGGRVILWDRSQAKPLQIIDLASVYAQDIAFLPGGTRLMGVTEQGDLLLWDAATGAQIDAFPTSRSQPTRIAIHPKNPWVAVSGHFGNIHVWDWKTKKLVKDLLFNKKISVWNAAFLPDGKTLVATTTDGLLVRWDTQSWKRTELKAHLSAIRGLAVHPTGASLATGGGKRTLFWDTSTWTQAGTIHTPAMALAYGPKGQRIALGDAQAQIHLWSLTPALKAERSLTGHRSSSGIGISSLDFHPTLDLLISSDGSGHMRIWESKTGAWLKRFQSYFLAQTSVIRDVVFGKNSGFLLTAASENSIVRWDVTTPGQARVSRTYSGAGGDGVALSPDDDQFLSSSSTRVLQSGSLSQGLDKSFPVLSRVLRFAFHPIASAHQAAYAMENGTVQLWDAQNQRDLKALTGHTKTPTSLAYHPQGTHLASAAEDHSIKIWDPTSGALLKTLTGHQDRIEQVLYSPTGRWLASSSKDKSVRLWDVANNYALKETFAHTVPFSSVAFHKTEQILLTAAGRDILFWQLTLDSAGKISKKSLGKISMPRLPVSSMAMSPDGKLLAAGGNTRDIGHVVLWRCPP